MTHLDTTGVLQKYCWRPFSNIENKKNKMYYIYKDSIVFDLNRKMEISKLVRVKEGILDTCIQNFGYNPNMSYFKIKPWISVLDKLNKKQHFVKTIYR